MNQSNRYANFDLRESALMADAIVYHANAANITADDPFEMIARGID